MEILHKHEKPLVKYSQLIGVLLIVSLIVGYGFFRKSQILKYGVFTVAKVINFEGAASGSSLYIDVYFQGKTFRTSVGNHCNFCIGKYYFVKIIKESPSKKIIFYNESPVPDCILSKGIPNNGWKDFPACADN